MVDKLLRDRQLGCSLRTRGHVRSEHQHRQHDGQGADEQLAGYHGFFDTYVTKLATAGRWLKYLRTGGALSRVHGYDFRSHRKRAMGALWRRIKQWRPGRKVRGQAVHLESLEEERQELERASYTGAVEIDDPESDD